MSFHAQVHFFSGCSFFPSHNQNNHFNSQIPENIFGTEFASSLSASFSLVSLQDSELNSETKFNGFRGADPPYHHNTTTKRRQTFPKLPCHKMESFIVFLFWTKNNIKFTPKSRALEEH